MDREDVLIFQRESAVQLLEDDRRRRRGRYFRPVILHPLVELVGGNVQAGAERLLADMEMHWHNLDAHLMRNAEWDVGRAVGDNLNTGHADGLLYSYSAEII